MLYSIRPHTGRLLRRRAALPATLAAALLRGFTARAARARLRGGRTT